MYSLALLESPTKTTKHYYYLLLLTFIILSLSKCLFRIANTFFFFFFIRVVDSTSSFHVLTNNEDQLLVNTSCSPNHFTYQCLLPSSYTTCTIITCISKIQLLLWKCSAGIIHMTDHYMQRSVKVILRHQQQSEVPPTIIIQIQKATTRNIATEILLLDLCTCLHTSCLQAMALGMHADNNYK